MHFKSKFCRYTENGSKTFMAWVIFCQIRSSTPLSSQYNLINTRPKFNSHTTWASDNHHQKVQFGPVPTENIGIFY